MVKKNCNCTSVIARIILALGLLSIGINQVQNSHSNFDPNLKWIQSFVKTKGIEVDTTVLRYVHLFLAYSLALSGVVTFFCSCSMTRSLALFAVIILNITSFVGFFSFVYDLVAISPGTVNMSRFLSYSEPHFVKTFIYMGALMLGI